MINLINNDVTLQPTLFMSMLGCKLQNRVSMQHDIFFGIAADIADLGEEIKAFWPSVESDIHMDAWRKVTHVDGYSIEVVKRQAQPNIANPSLLKLFFINRGGYRLGQFAEFQSRVLVIAQDKKAAVCKVKESLLYTKSGFKGVAGIAKHGIGEDDILAVDDLLSPLIRSQYQLLLKKVCNSTMDKIHMDYIPLHRLISSSNHLVL